MAFGQLIEYSKRNTFLEKFYTKFGRQTIPRPFLKNQNQNHIFGSAVLSFIQFVFILCSSQELSSYIETKLQSNCFYLIWSFFCKTRKGMELVFMPHFLHGFWRKIFNSCYILLTDQISLCYCLYLLIYCAICVLYLFVNQVVTS